MRRTALVLALAGMFACTAQGAVTLLSAHRQSEINGVSTDLSQPGPYDFHDAAPSLAGPYTGLDAVQQSLHNIVFEPRGTASAMASQLSFFTHGTDGQFTGASFAGAAAATASSFPPVGTAAAAATWSSFLFDVTDESLSYSINVHMTPPGQGPNSTLISLYTVEPPYGTALVLGPAVFQIGPDQASASPYSEAGPLAPGRYWLTSSVAATAQAWSGGAYASSASMEYTFTLVPEPVSMALLALGAGVVLRRR